MDKSLIFHNTVGVSRTIQNSEITNEKFGHSSYTLTLFFLFFFYYMHLACDNRLVCLSNFSTP